MNEEGKAMYHTNIYKGNSTPALMQAFNLIG